MKTNAKIILALVIVVVIAAIYAWSQNSSQVAPAPTNTAVQVPAPTGNLITTVSYSCDGGKTIIASFYSGSSTPAVSPGEPPQPGGSVAIILGDGRSMVLPQTISADGGRYANADESFIFWSKGNGAFVMENGTTTYANCNQN